MSKKQGIIKEPEPVFNQKNFIDMVLSELFAYGQVKVTGLGVFSLKKMRAKKGFNPGSGEYQNFPAYGKIVFAPTKELKESISLWNQKK